MVLLFSTLVNWNPVSIILKLWAVPGLSFFSRPGPSAKRPRPSIATSFPSFRITARNAIGRVNPDEGIRPIWGYLVALVIGLVVVAAVPWLSTGFLGS